MPDKISGVWRETVVSQFAAVRHRRIHLLRGYARVRNLTTYSPPGTACPRLDRYMSYTAVARKCNRGPPKDLPHSRFAAFANFLALPEKHDAAGDQQ